MIAPDRSLVRSLRTQVRRAVARDANWRRQRKRVPSRWRQNLPWTKLRAVVTLGAFAAAWLGMPPERLLGFGLLWTLCVTFSRAGQIAAALSSPQLLWLPYQLPVENALWLREQRGAVVRSSGWLAADWLAVGLGYALGTGQLAWWVAAPLLGAAQGLAALALAVWAVRAWPTGPFMGGATLCWMGLIVCSQSYESVWGHAHIVTPVFRALAWCTPGGWLRALAESAVAGQVAAWAGLLGVASASVVLARAGARRLEENFSPEKIFGYGDDEAEHAPGRSLEIEATEAEGSFAPAEVALPPVSEAGRAELREKLVAELERPAALGLFARGWMERWIVRALSLRQRVLVDFLQVSPPWSWGRGWLIALVALGMLRLWQLAVGATPPVAIATVTVWVVFVLPVFGGTWRGFDGLTAFHARLGVQSLAPVGFAEVAGTMLWVNTLRLLFALPLVWLSVRYLFTVEPLGWAQSLNFTLQIAVLVAVVQPFRVIVAFSKTTNDTSARWWFTALIGLAAMVFLVGSVMMGVLVAAAVEGVEAWIGLGAWLVLSYLLLLGYGAAYRWAVFDLVNTSGERAG